MKNPTCWGFLFFLWDLDESCQKKYIKLVILAHIKTNEDEKYGVKKNSLTRYF